jgi:hypothetical protein
LSPEEVRRLGLEDDEHPGIRWDAELAPADAAACGIEVLSWGRRVKDAWTFTTPDDDPQAAQMLALGLGPWFALLAFWACGSWVRWVFSGPSATTS